MTNFCTSFFFLLINLSEGVNYTHIKQKRLPAHIAFYSEKKKKCPQLKNFQSFLQVGKKCGNSLMFDKKCLKLFICKMYDAGHSCVILFGNFCRDIYFYADVCTCGKEQREQATKH